MDNWLTQSTENPPGPLGEDSLPSLKFPILSVSLLGLAVNLVFLAEERRLAVHHKFRERCPELELAHPNVSPARYFPEFDRIRETIHSQKFVQGRYTGEESNVGRERDRSLDIQPTMRFKPRTDGERINQSISQNPVMPLQPWTRFDNPTMRKIRDEDKARWKAGYGRDFDRFSSASRVTLENKFLFSQLEYDPAAPLKHPFGSKHDWYCSRNKHGELAGDFRNIVPGYSPDSSMGKWRMLSPNVPGGQGAWFTASRGNLACEDSIASPFSAHTDQLSQTNSMRLKSYWKASIEVVHKGACNPSSSFRVSHPVLCFEKRNRLLVLVARPHTSSQKLLRADPSHPPSHSYPHSNSSRASASHQRPGPAWPGPARCRCACAYVCSPQ